MCILVNVLPLMHRCKENDLFLKRKQQNSTNQRLHAWDIARELLLSPSAKLCAATQKVKIYLKITLSLFLSYLLNPLIGTLVS